MSPYRSHSVFQKLAIASFFVVLSLVYMKEEAVVRQKEIPYHLTRRVNARSVRVSVFPGGEVRVVAPRLLPRLFIERFLKEKKSWIESERAKMKDIPKKKTKKERRALYLEHKEAARAFVLERIAHFNRHYGFAFSRVSIRDQHSRWGSCSRKGNLNFNYRLVLIPPALADYVIVHELCHLREFNHREKFWALVGEQIPDYETLRAQLHHHKHN